jgi:hypothetical protein
VIEDTGFMTERTLFLNALALTDPVERAAYLDAACAGAPALRARIEALLHSSDVAGSFLDVPAVEQLAAQMGDPYKPAADRRRDHGPVP